jgi:hypothetical protein
VAEFERVKGLDNKKRKRKKKEKPATKFPINTFKNPCIASSFFILTDPHDFSTPAGLRV